MEQKTKEVLEELRLMPLVGIVHLKGEYLRTILDYIAELEQK